MCQYELLLRVGTGQGSEQLLPSSFLYVAERFNLIQEMDCWVACRAIELIAEYGRSGRRLVLHVNLSAKSIGDPRVTGVIEDAISNAGIDPECLVFELTETTAITNIESAKTFAHRLRSRGCRFALDDFGAGFGSFYYLKSLAFDYFKIDGDFIRGLVATPMDLLVVEAIVGIARGMGKKTIAEFVPDEETSRLLEKSGVDYAQGYHVGRPKPLREVLPSCRSPFRHSGQRGLVSSIRHAGPDGYSGPSNLTNAGTSSGTIQTCSSGGTRRPRSVAKTLSQAPAVVSGRSGPRSSQARRPGPSARPRAPAPAG